MNILKACSRYFGRRDIVRSSTRNQNDDNKEQQVAQAVANILEKHNHFKTDVVHLRNELLNEVHDTMRDAIDPRLDDLEDVMKDLLAPIMGKLDALDASYKGLMTKLDDIATWIREHKQEPSKALVVGGENPADVQQRNKRGIDASSSLGPGQIERPQKRVKTGPFKIQSILDIEFSSPDIPFSSPMPPAVTPVLSPAPKPAASVLALHATASAKAKRTFPATGTLTVRYNGRLKPSIQIIQHAGNLAARALDAEDVVEGDVLQVVLSVSAPRYHDDGEPIRDDEDAWGFTGGIGICWKALGDKRVFSTLRCKGTTFGNTCSSRRHAARGMDAMIHAISHGIRLLTEETQPTGRRHAVRKAWSRVRIVVVTGTDCQQAVDCIAEHQSKQHRANRLTVAQEAGSTKAMFESLCQLSEFLDCRGWEAHILYEEEDATVGDFARSY